MQCSFNDFLKSFTPWSWSMKWRNTETCRTIFKSKLAIDPRAEPNREPNFHFHPSSRPQLFYLLELASPTPRVCGKRSAYLFHTGRFIRFVYSNNLSSQRFFHFNDQTRAKILQWYQISFSFRDTRFLKQGQQISWTPEIELSTETVSLTLCVTLDTRIEHNFLSISFENCINQRFWIISMHGL